MARYFFHVVGAGSTFPDEAGRSFPTLQDAEAHAAVIAGELSGKHESYHSWSTDSGRRQLRRRRPKMHGIPDGRQFRNARSLFSLSGAVRRRDGRRTRSRSYPSRY
jgi:hypothetical protein